MTKKDLYIIGAGGLGREVAAMVQHCPLLSMLYKVRAFVDDDSEKSQIGGISVQQGVVDVLSSLPDDTSCAIAIGDSKTRKRIYEKVSDLPLRWPNLIHSSVSVLDSSSFKKGKGIIISARTTLTTQVQIDDFAVVNLHCTLGHDVHLSRFVSVMPGSSLSGGVQCREASYIGTGAILLNGVTIGEESVVGAGAVVRHAVEAKTKVAGVPATVI